jgi:hypothetical protein
MTLRKPASHQREDPPQGAGCPQLALASAPQSQPLGRLSAASPGDLVKLFPLITKVFPLIPQAIHANKVGAF